MAPGRRFTLVLINIWIGDVLFCDRICERKKLYAHMKICVLHRLTFNTAVMAKHAKDSKEVFLLFDKWIFSVSMCQKN